MMCRNKSQERRCREEGHVKSKAEKGVMKPPGMPGAIGELEKAGNGPPRPQTAGPQSSERIHVCWQKPRRLGSLVTTAWGTKRAPIGCFSRRSPQPSADGSKVALQELVAINDANVCVEPSLLL